VEITVPAIRLLRLPAMPCILAACALSLTTPAEAQFGKLLKKAVGNAAGNAVGNAAGDAAGTTVANSRPLTNVDRLEGLTTADLGALLKGYEAELASAPTAAQEAEEAQKKQDAVWAAYNKANEEYNRAEAKYDACKQKFDKDEEAATKAISDKAEKSMTVAQPDMADMQKAKAAAERGATKGTMTAEDAAAMQKMTAMGQAMQRQSAGAMAAMSQMQERARTTDARLLKACGQAPVDPARPTDQLSWDKSRVTTEKGAKGAGMPVAMYISIREPALAYRFSKVTTKSYAPAVADTLNIQLDSARVLYKKMSAAKIPL
jgi:hypothetical protein